MLELETFLKATRKAILISTCLLVGSGDPVTAQVIPDNTLSNPSVVNPTGTVHEITGGVTRGGNLFHSFEEFSLAEDDTAFFDQVLTIDRIIARVTGGDRSAIDGLIRANGRADLFLINPNGITFGPNARLDIGGSFVASTADRIDFADGTVFSARNPSTSPLLTVSLPVGLQLGANPGDIIVQGTGHNLSFDADNFVIDRSRQSAGLQVNSGETLALAGNSVTLEGGNLSAPGGRIEVGSLNANESVRLAESALGWRFDYRDVAQFQDIRLSQASSIDVSSSGSGTIQLQGRHIQVRGGSAILANTQGNDSGGRTLLRAEEKITVTGFLSEISGEESIPLFPSSVISGLETNATGTGGTLTVRAPRIRVVDGGIISTNNLGLGSAGDLSVDASRSLTVRGGIPELFFSSGVVADVYGEGDGGALSIETGYLSVTGGGELSASTLAQGNSGTLTIHADTVDVFAGAAFLGASSILTSVQSDASGNAGDLMLNTDRLFVSGGATVLSNTFGNGDAGDLQITARTIDISGRSPGGNPSGLFAQTLDGSGAGGDLSLQTDVLRVSEGATISASTFNTGDAGNLEINAQEIYLTGTDANVTGLFAAVNSGASGAGGVLSIEAELLHVLEGAQIAAGTQGSSDAGLLRVEAHDILLSGSSAIGRSGLFASAIIGTGAGGDIRVRGDRLTIENGAVISASNFPSSGDLSGIGQGPAGDIQITVTDIDLLNQGRITASTSTGGRGNITIQSDNVSMLDRSLISTNAQGQEPGGNITIHTGWLSGFENSDITANAEDSFGGRILINADLIVGLEFREELTPGNDVTATSELGSEFNGVVEINATEIETFPEHFPERVIVNPEEVVAACEQFRGNELVLTGRGGLPADPSQVLRSPIVWQDWRLAESLANADNLNAPHANAPHANALHGALSRITESDTQFIHPQEATHDRRAIAPIEAEGWTKTESGEIQLVAQGSLAHGRGYEGSVVDCREWR